MKKATPLLFLALLFFSCSDPINKKLSKESFNDDVKAIKEKYGTQYTEADFAEFKEKASNKITAQLMGINKDENITYKTILDSVKAQRTRDDSTIAKYKSDLDKINSSVPFSLDSGQYVKGPEGEAYVYKLNWNNKTDKKLISVEGTFEIKSPDGDIIKKIYLKENAAIEPHEESGIATSDNIFDWDKPSDLEKYEFKNLSISWTPEILVFEDNSKLKAPEKPYALTKREGK